MAPRPGSEPTPPPSQSALRAREQFVSEGAVRPGVIRAEIEASWSRSRALAVNVDRVEPAYVERLDHDTLLARGAAPVLESLRMELAGEPIGILLTDAHGTVLDRQCPDPGMTRLLDIARLAPGFVFAESSVGTNGIGMALELRTSTMVTGTEHYVESLQQFGCAGAPILHPVTGAFMGIIDFTARAPHVNPLLLTFARSTARRVQDQLLGQTSAPELALMREYLAACHHTGGSVLAVSDGLVMMNVHTQQHYDLADQTALLARIADVSGSAAPQTVLAQLPSGGAVRLDYRPTTSAGRVAGGVVRVHPLARPVRRVGRAAPAPVTLPGVVGTSPLWLRTVSSVVEARRAGEWLVLEGEAGVGKVLLARTAQQAYAAGDPSTVLDAADASEPDWLDRVADALARRTGGLVITHVDALAAGVGPLLTERLREASGSGPWVALTVRTGGPTTEPAADLLSVFPRTVEVPPLRQHLSDLDRLVTHLLDGLVHGGSPTLSVAAANQLKRLPWPGNVSELRRLLVQVVHRRRGGVIEEGDLPPAARATSRRRLTPLEAMERDAIVAALQSTDGSKDRAAQTLGLSRATIYRKIRDYGILTG